MRQDSKFCGNHQKSIFSAYKLLLGTYKKININLIIGVKVLLLNQLIKCLR